jgi:hypothetical protein
MPITLSLTARADRRPTRAEALGWLDRAADWFENRGDAVLDARVTRDADDRAHLVVSFHPAAEPVQVRLGGSGKVRVFATTTPAGPGYHAHLCDTLDQLAAEFDLEWDDAESKDDSGYFGSRDRAALDAAFRRWLATACVAAEVNGSKASVGLPQGHGFHATGEVLTPLGPRPQTWLATAAESPQDFFPWWNADLDAAFYRNRALVRLWCDFTWRAPLTEAEGELADQIANDLASAFKLDPAAELPWEEWLELLDAIRADEEGFTVSLTDDSLSIQLWKRAHPPDPKRAGPKVGYRRFPLRAQLASGWSVEVPGDFAREWAEKGIWTAWNRTRSVWFHCLGLTNYDGDQASTEQALDVGRRTLPEGVAVPGFERNGVVGEAVVGTTAEDGRTVHRLGGIAAVPGQLVTCNVYFTDPADQDWAVKTWQSLRHA